MTSTKLLISFKLAFDVISNKKRQHWHSCKKEFIVWVFFLLLIYSSSRRISYIFKWRGFASLVWVSSLVVSI